MKHALYSDGDKAQLQRCLQWSTDNLVSVQVFKDEGISGMTESRPAFDAMMAEIRAGRIKGVIVFSLDRLARSVQHLVNILAEWKRAGVALVAVSQGIDTRTSNPTATLQLHILAAFAEFERAMIVERVRTGQANARRKGVKFGRPETAQTPEQAAAIAAHFAAHGTGKTRELGRTLGTDHAQAGRWLRKHAEQLNQVKP